MVSISSMSIIRCNNLTIHWVNQRPDPHEVLGQCMVLKSQDQSHLMIKDQWPLKGLTAHFELTNLKSSNCWRSLLQPIEYIGDSIIRRGGWLEFILNLFVNSLSLLYDEREVTSIIEQGGGGRHSQAVAEFERHPGYSIVVFCHVASCNGFWVG